MQRCRLSVDTDVGDVAARADKFGAQLKRGGYADSLDRHVDPEPFGQLVDDDNGILALVVDGEVGAELLGYIETRSAISIEITIPGEKSFAPVIVDKPIGPAPTTATVSPGCTCPFRTPTS